MSAAGQTFACLLAVGLAISHPTQAQTAARMQITDLRTLLKLAIEQGSASGVLVGQAAAYIRQRFDAPAPIEVDVRALQALSEPGCSRLEITTRQVGVLENGKREDKTLTYQVNYCRDGRIPEKP